MFQKETCIQEKKKNLPQTLRQVFTLFSHMGVENVLLMHFLLCRSILSWKDLTCFAGMLNM